MALQTQTSAPTTTASLPLGADKYRGAVVEDLQLPPAFAIPQDERLSRAIEMAYERDFSHIPVLSKDRKPLGYLDVTSLKSRWEAGDANLNPNEEVLAHITKFIRSASHPYTLITPATPLAELEAFLHENIFAIVTDHSRKFVLGVATGQDLEKFVSRRGVY